MRIIAGTHKGQKIITSKKLLVRPTANKTKEALFNILSHQFNFSNISFLELFAGTGSISFEVASRGGKNITLVENNKYCIQSINNTNQKMEFNIKIIQKNVFQWLQKSRTPFDIIFADPPYNFSQEEYYTILDLIYNNNWLAEEGKIILEHNNKIAFKEHLNWKNTRKYGDSCFSFFNIKKSRQ